MPGENHQPRRVIGLDVGTSAIKGVLADLDGHVLAEAVAPTELLRPREGWVEVQPHAHYANVCRVIRSLGHSAGGTVAAVAMAAASGNTLLTDSAGKPLHDIINWMDQRARQPLPQALAALARRQVHQVVGWPCVDIFPLAHLAWLREHRRGLYDSAGHYGMDSDWLIHRLAGQWVMDHSTATTFHLVDQLSGEYHRPFLELLGIPRDRLSRLVPSGSVVGRLSAAAAEDTGLSQRTLVVAGCFDHPAAARAVGVVRPGQLMLSCGTSWVGFTPRRDRQEIIDAGMLCDPFLSDRGGCWAGMFSVPSIGATIDWYVENVIAPAAGRRAIEVFNELAAACSDGAEGLTIDLRQPPRRPAGAHPAAVARAVMEGAARLLNEKIIDLKQRGMSFTAAVMVGGPAASPVWPGIVQQITGIEVTAGRRSAGAAGAARLAAAAVDAVEEAPR